MFRRCSLLRWAVALLCSLSLCHIAYLYVSVVHFDFSSNVFSRIAQPDVRQVTSKGVGISTLEPLESQMHKLDVTEETHGSDSSFADGNDNNAGGEDAGTENDASGDSDDDEDEKVDVGAQKAPSQKSLAKGLVHVAYAPDKKQALAVQASIASVVAAATDPSRVVVHLLVDEASASDFRRALGVKKDCSKFNLTSGTRIYVHDFNAALVSRSIAEVPDWVTKVRGKLDSPMNYVRFYMHKLIDGYFTEGQSQVVTYLDTDTIVKGNIAEVAGALSASGKTLGFVKRPSANTVPPKQMIGAPLKEKPWCSRRSGKWNDLLKGHTYNVGVFTVDLRRWTKFKLTERVEQLVKEHNQCDGKLWVGGSQPPMLLAVLEHALQAGEQDYIEYSSSWNVDGLGWKKNMKASKLSGARVLHWTGKGKPWTESGLYKSWWQPHLEHWHKLFIGSAAATPQLSADSTKALEGKGTCKLMLEHGSAVAVGTSKPKNCLADGAWSCADDGSGVHVNHGCSGLFLIGKHPTFCAPTTAKEPDFCVSGTRPTPSSACGIMFLTTYFVGIKDWQGKRDQATTFGKIKKFYYTSLYLGLNVTFLHDGLPDDMMSIWQSNQVHFIQVDLAVHAEEKLGVNDVRYFHFVDAIEKHPEWQNVFVLDGFDVLVKMNPCPFLKPGKLYIGSEPTTLERNGWLAIRFKDMGGDYMKWYKKQSEYKTRNTLNCGITGGDRDSVLKLFKRMLSVFLDDNLKVRRKNKEVNVNMAVLNYVVYREYLDELVTGDTMVHSTYWKQQNRRDDIWFVHK